MSSPLDNLAGLGKALAAEPPDAKEFAGLKRAGLARLNDAKNATNSLEGRFDPGVQEMALRLICRRSPFRGPGA